MLKPRIARLEKEAHSRRPRCQYPHREIVTYRAPDGPPDTACPKCGEPLGRLVREIVVKDRADAILLMAAMQEA